MKTFVLQNVNTAGKIENYTSAYYLFEQDQSFWLNDGWVHCVYCPAFRRYCLIPPQLFGMPFALFYLKQ